MLPCARDTVAALLAPEGSGPALLTVGGDSIDHAALGSRSTRLAERLRAAGSGPGRPDRHRAAQRPGDGAGPAGGHVGRLRGTAEPEVPRGGVPLLPRRPPRRGPRDRRQRARSAVRRAGGPRSSACSAMAWPSTSTLAGRAGRRDRAAAVDAAAAARRRPRLEAAAPADRRRRSARPPHVRHDLTTEDRAAAPAQPGRVGAEHRRGAAPHRGRPLADRHAAVPHPRDHGRAAGPAVGRRVASWPRPGSTPSSSTAGSTTLRPTYYTAVPTMHQMVLARSHRAPPHDQPALRAVVVRVAARPGARRPAGAVRRARRRGLRDDGGLAPDDLQPAPAGRGQAGIGRGRDGDRGGDPRRRAPPAAARRSGRGGHPGRHRRRRLREQPRPPTRRRSPTAGSAPATKGCSTTTATSSSPAA